MKYYLILIISHCTLVQRSTTSPPPPSDVKQSSSYRHFCETFRRQMRCFRELCRRSKLSHTRITTTDDKVIFASRLPVYHCRAAADDCWNLWRNHCAAVRAQNAITMLVISLSLPYQLKLQNFVEQFCKRRWSICVSFTSIYLHGWFCRAGSFPYRCWVPIDNQTTVVTKIKDAWKKNLSGLRFPFSDERYLWIELNLKKEKKLYFYVFFGSEARRRTF